LSSRGLKAFSECVFKSIFFFRELILFAVIPNFIWSFGNLPLREEEKQPNGNTPCFLKSQLPRLIIPFFIIRSSVKYRAKSEENDKEGKMPRSLKIPIHIHKSLIERVSPSYALES
jgi:hypothetical protein